MTFGGPPISTDTWVNNELSARQRHAAATRRAAGEGSASTHRPEQAWTKEGGHPCLSARKSRLALCSLLLAFLCRRCIASPKGLPMVAEEMAADI